MNIAQTTRFNCLPLAPGVGFKSRHFAALMDDPGAVEWIEVHAENYMGDGGRPLAQLTTLAERFAISIHGVGLSIGGEQPLDRTHLDRLARLMKRIPTASFSEHLAWSTHDGDYFNDLLPLPYTDATLNHVVSHINQVQDHLARPMLLENPSSYLLFEESTWSESDFIREVHRRSGCGLLLDLNNVFISATNLDSDAFAYIDQYPLEAVAELHLGGHEVDHDDHGETLLIDSHSRPVADPVWLLLDEVLRRRGGLPVLIEWDNDVPEWPVLRAEADAAARALQACQ
ncbi:DUF692 domain-containing protein [Gammaproteobacteria bacterium]|nr:DUF692 domain-containing protein [Gammaproteobacteria bacterium]